jgi:hypothetical protein
MKFIESVKLAGAAYVGVKLGERLYLALSKTVHKKELSPGCVYLHRTTRETVIIDSVIPGSLFKKPTVEFLAKRKRLQVELGEFLKQFEYAQYSVRGE